MKSRDQDFSIQSVVFLGFVMVLEIDHRSTFIFILLYDADSFAFHSQSLLNHANNREFGLPPPPCWDIIEKVY